MQHAVLNGSSSSCSQVTSGVREGSVLGPINDIDAAETLHCALFKFTDDTKAEASKLQNDLNNLHNLSVEWQMLFNFDKCHMFYPL